jgi:hypothetical protein
VRARDETPHLSLHCGYIYAARHVICAEDWAALAGMRAEDYVPALFFQFLLAKKFFGSAFLHV